VKKKLANRICATSSYWADEPLGVIVMKVGLYHDVRTVDPTDQTTEPICTHDISNDADCSKEVPFGGLIDEKFFSRGSIIPPQIFKGQFTCKSKKSNNF
jgi:hypothetical protein